MTSAITEQEVEAASRVSASWVFELPPVMIREMLEAAASVRPAVGGREVDLLPIATALDKLPPRPWTLWTSCSFRRIGGATGRDGDVLSAFNQRSDGHPDLTMPEDQLQALVDLVNRADTIINLSKGVGS